MSPVCKACFSTASGPILDNGGKIGATTADRAAAAATAAVMASVLKAQTRAA